MSKHNPDLVMCRRLVGIGAARLCDKCDGRCPICDSYVQPTVKARVCDDCNSGPAQGRCIICGGPGTADAFYCRSCAALEKDRDGCPRIINVGAAKADMFYERRKQLGKS
eukprot:ANDGO_08467.mRNA.1 PHD finger-like domain-containing protein 5A